jgi:hydroxyacylglutathione hydrolase
MPFFVLKLFWSYLVWYTRVIKKRSHRVKCPFQNDTALKSLEVITIPTLWDNYSYIIHDGHDAVIVDPSETAPILEVIQQNRLELTRILLTHYHIDHIMGIKSLYNKFKPQILASKHSLLPVPFTPIDNKFNFIFADSIFEAYSVPGHHASPYPITDQWSNIAWYNKKAGILFTGDTLFSCGYGYIEYGSEQMIWESLSLLRSLPDETKIFCGHEYTLGNTRFAHSIDPDNKTIQTRLTDVKKLLAEHRPTIPTTLAIEKKINPFLRWDDSRLKNILGIEQMSGFESFLHIRNQKIMYNNKK